MQSNPLCVTDIRPAFRPDPFKTMQVSRDCSAQSGLNFFNFKGVNMKNVVAFAALVLLSLSAQAENVKFINADGSALGELCIAAVETESAVSFLADELGISPLDVNEVNCNGKPISSFVRQYREEKAQFVFSVENASPETKLCLAALTSDEEYEAIKQSLFTKLDRVESSVSCNGMSVKQFARKYRERVAAISDKTTASL